MTGLPYGGGLEAFPEGQRILARDWSQHPFGPIGSWDEGLLAGLSQLLPMGLPAAVIWGEVPRLFFNGGFEKLFADRCLVQGQAIGDPEDALWKALLAYHAEPREMSIEALGHAEWWQVAQSPLYARSGQIQGRLAVFVSLSARKLAETALQASEETLQALMDQQPSFLWRSDPTGRPVWINRVGRHYLGIDNAGGFETSRRIPPPDLAILLMEIRARTSERKAFEIQIRIRNQKGDPRWFLLHFSPLTDIKGHIHAWSGSGADIHEWHCAASEAARHGIDRAGEVHRAYDRYGRNLFGWIAEIETGRLSPLNPRGGAEWGLPRDGPPELWADWLMRLPLEQRDQADDTFSRAAEGEAVEDIWTMTTPRGVEKQVHLMAFPIRDEDGTVRRIGGILSVTKTPINDRVYLINPDEDFSARSELGRALLALEARVRRYDGFEPFALMQSDLRGGLVIVLLKAPEHAGLLKEALPMLHNHVDRFPWLAITDYDADLRDVVEMMRHGAMTVLPKGADRTEIAVSVRAAMPRRIVEAPVKVQKVDRLADLSERERQVLDGLMAGGTNKSIAAQLGLSPRTVETHRAHLMDRLGARSLADLLRIGAEHNVIPFQRQKGREG